MSEDDSLIAKGRRDFAAARGLAANVLNTLAPSVVRLPLGHQRSYPKGTEQSIFTLRNPTFYGGKLTLRLLGASRAAMSLRKTPRGDVIATGKAGVIEYEFRRDEVGKYYLIVDQTAATVSAEFLQTGYAREGVGEKEAPLIPWNFWYWPTVRSMEFSELPPMGAAEEKAWREHTSASGGDKNYWTWKARRVLTAYGQTLEDPLLRDGAGQEAYWHQHATGSAWEGHCHWAAMASALFEPPGPKVFKGQSFSVSDIKFLAAEYTGLHVNPSELKDAFRLDLDPDAEVRETGFGILELLQPEAGELRLQPGVDSPGLPDPSGPTGTHTLAALREGLKRALPPKMRARLAPIYESKYASKYGGEAGVESAFGVRAAELLRYLQEHVLRDGLPLFSDLRSLSGGGPEQVWNQVVFLFEAKYVEALPASDDRRYVINARLVANRDEPPPESETFPARVVDNRCVVSPEKSLVSLHTFLLSFGESGHVLTDRQPRWIRCRNHRDELIYGPRYLNPARKPQATPRVGTGADSHRDIGNTSLSKGFLENGFGRLRKRFQ